MGSVDRIRNTMAELDRRAARIKELEGQLAAKDKEIEALKIALSDAIRRPMGVMPDSATGLITEDDIRQAEIRRAAIKEVE